MIEKISLKNFKSHADTTIGLGRVTALVGPNGCGKTSVLQAVHLVCQFAPNLDRSVFKNSDLPLRLVRSGQNNWSASLFLKDQLAQIEINVLFDPEHESSVRFQDTVDNNLPVVMYRSGYHTKVRARNGETTVTQDSDPDSMIGLRNEQSIKRFVHSAYYKGVAENMAAPSYSDSTTPRLMANGEGLASIIANLILTDRSKHEAMEWALSAIVPTIKTFRARPAKVVRKERKVFSVNGAQFPYEEDRELIGHELIFDTTSGDTLTADLISEGTLLVMGILALIYDLDPPQMILLDDIESGLHPLAQRKLVKIIREFAEKHDKQILLTTHSGYIVDELEPDDVWVLQTDNEGISHAKRLSEHQDAKRLLEVLTTGELADAVGEDWVLPQAPQAIAAGEANA